MVQGPPSFPSLSFPFLPPLLLFPLSFPLSFSSLPLEVGPSLRLVGPGDRFSFPSGTGQSPAAKRYLVNFRLKISPLVSTIFRSFARNETSNWGRGTALLKKYHGVEPSGNVLVQTNCFDINAMEDVLQGCGDVWELVVLRCTFFVWALGPPCPP